MRIAAFVALALSLHLGEAGAQGVPASPFPHEQHERLFPLCESCHAGIASGNVATAMPTEASCRECHNGTDAKLVTWRRTTHAPGLLRFSHVTHAGQVDSSGRACATCHNVAGEPRMRVNRATAPTCLTCHTHRASEHLGADNRCATCHVPLTQAPRLNAGDVAKLPKPPSHSNPSFASVHAPSTPAQTSSCATCHARESCARCHVNARNQTLIASLGRDPRVAALTAGKPAFYPSPADHRNETFATGHGDRARENIASCATCHARPSCTTCHVGGRGNSLVANMPLAERGGAPGVSLRLVPARRRAPPHAAADAADTITTATHPVRVHNATFRTSHKAQASMSASCAGCHERSFCSDCHTGEAAGSRQFHPANFAQRHATNSWGRQAQCASCHNTELFCRSCHRTSGLATTGRLDAAYHDAQPQWLLQHGRAARQGLQSCATCHAQRDCLACHSTLGWGVNPHGPGFRAGRLAGLNATQCLMCHLRVPGR
jgi:hypothetical protein